MTIFYQLLLCKFGQEAGSFKLWKKKRKNEPNDTIPLNCAANLFISINRKPFFSNISIHLPSSSYCNEQLSIARLCVINENKLIWKKRTTQGYHGNIHNWYNRFCFSSDWFDMTCNNHSCQLRKSEWVICMRLNHQFLVVMKFVCSDFVYWNNIIFSIRIFRENLLIILNNI